MRMRPGERTFAVVGGGRWARVYLSVIAEFDFPYRVVVVSSANAAALAGVRAGRTGAVEVVPSIDDLKRHGPIAAALVVNPAVSHAEAACRLLGLGVPVLVEKPIALRMEQVERIYSAASGSGLLVVPALTFLHCSYLERFARMIGGDRAGPPKRVLLEWHDPVTEHRHGEEKSHDGGISIGQDVMPHVWSILSVVLGRPQAGATVQRCAIERGGRDVRYTLSFDGTPCDVRLQRAAHGRRRFIGIEWSRGATVSLDFTVEPGIITAGAQSFNADPDWHGVRRPVRRQLDQFVSELAGTTVSGHWRGVAAACTSLVQQADDCLKREQAALLRGSPVCAWNDDIAYALHETLAPRLLADRRVAPGDRHGLRQQLDRSVSEMRARSGADNWHSAQQSLDARTTRCTPASSGTKP